jgi:hypothetical protein
MDGEAALRYVRTRLDDDVYGRAHRNQQSLKAMWDQTKDTDLVPKIPALWSALRGNFETDLTLAEVLTLIPTALDIEPERVSSRYIGLGQAEPWVTPEGWWVLVPDPEQVRRLVASLYAPLSEDELSEEGARVEVQNGTQRTQLELIAADELYWQGLDVVETGPADRRDYEQTRIVVFNDRPQSLARLASVLDVGEEKIVEQLDPGLSLDFRVILGKDYDPCR